LISIRVNGLLYVCKKRNLCDEIKKKKKINLYVKEIDREEREREGGRGPHYLSDVTQKQVASYYRASLIFSQNESKDEMYRQSC